MLTLSPLFICNAFLRWATQNRRCLLNASLNKSNLKNMDNSNNILFEPFARYVWEKLESNGLALDSDDKWRNVGKLGNGKNVTIEVKVLPGSEEPIRLARYALLSTHDTDKFTPNFEGSVIEVLNLVIFPSPKTQLPVFGADMVILPGNKNLMLIDFQPVSSNKITSSGEGILTLPNQEFHKKLQRLHDKYNNADCLPWGGDVPSEVKRFMSMYALWTRLPPQDTFELVHTKVFEAFKDYFHLYIELCEETIKQDLSHHNHDFTAIHQEYITYRKENDPARPMLRRLYGEEWSEMLLEKVLFPPI